jgi:hypothetical protein
MGRSLIHRYREEVGWGLGTGGNLVKALVEGIYLLIVLAVLLRT